MFESVDHISMEDMVLYNLTREAHSKKEWALYSRKQWRAIFYCTKYAPNRFEGERRYFADTSTPNEFISVFDVIDVASAVRALDRENIFTRYKNYANSLARPDIASAVKEKNLAKFNLSMFLFFNNPLCPKTKDAITALPKKDREEVLRHLLTYAEIDIIKTCFESEVLVSTILDAKMPLSYEQAKFCLLCVESKDVLKLAEYSFYIIFGKRESPLTSDIIEVLIPHAKELVEFCRKDTANFIDGMAKSGVGIFYYIFKIAALIEYLLNMGSTFTWCADAIALIILQLLDCGEEVSVTLSAQLIKMLEFISDPYVINRILSRILVCTEIQPLVAKVFTIFLVNNYSIIDFSKLKEGSFDIIFKQISNPYKIVLYGIDVYKYERMLRELNISQEEKEKFRNSCEILME